MKRNFLLNANATDKTANKKADAKKAEAKKPAKIVEAKKAVTQNGLPQNRIVHTLPEKGEYALIVTDGFCTDAALGSALHECAPVIAIDEGSRRSDWADFLIDIIPPLKNKTVLNKYAPYFIPLSVTRNKLEPALKKTVSRILICLGGEDPSNLALPAARCFARVLRGTHVHITVVTSAAETARAAAKEANISYVPFIPGLPERIGEYDLVVTHYGFTAFEAASAGCLLLLLATSTLHKKLARKYGCVCIEKKQLSEKKIHSLLSEPECLQPKTLCSLLNTAEAAGTVSVACTAGTGKARDLAPFIASLTGGKRRNCPLCSNLNGLQAELNLVVARDEVKTVRRCRSCGMLYISWLCVPKKEYSKAYFFEEYKKQYGKTYLEDFASIKAQGLRRMALINRLCRTKAVRQPAQKSAQKPLQKPAQNEAAVLDIGCAYGAFLSAAADFLWQPFGFGISTRLTGLGLYFLLRILSLISTQFSLRYWSISSTDIPSILPAPLFAFTLSNAANILSLLNIFSISADIWIVSFLRYASHPLIPISYGISTSLRLRYYLPRRIWMRTFASPFDS